MKKLIPMDEYGMFADMKDTARVDSRLVAQMFEKEHKNVLRDIDAILSTESGFSKEFGRLNFEPSSYTNQQNKKQRCYAMTRDGFTMLVMGFTGKKAAQFKEMYIKRFNEMEQTIKTLVSAREQFPMLTEQIRLLHDSPKPYHFSNEADMLNRLALGQTAKQFREARGLNKGESIRPYLTKEQLDLLDRLQTIDLGLLVSTPDFETRKRFLEWWMSKQPNAGGMSECR